MDTLKEIAPKQDEAKNAALIGLPHELLGIKGVKSFALIIGPGVEFSADNQSNVRRRRE